MDCSPLWRSKIYRYRRFLTIPSPQTSCIKIGHLFHIWTPILIQECTEIGALFTIKPPMNNEEIFNSNKNRLHANISAIAEPVFLYSHSNPRPIIVKWGVKNPPRDVKSNDSPPTYSQCVSSSHPRTQTSSPRRDGRWHALP